jgi:citryl-CoA lyase
LNSRKQDDKDKDEPEFVTSISRVAPGEINIRGYDVRDVMHQSSFSEGAFLTIIGRRPTSAELRVFDAILCSCLDHGLVNTLTVSARYVMSGSASVPAAIAAGVLCFGPYTGTAHLTAELLIELTQTHGPDPSDAAIDAALRLRRDVRQPIPGLGHPIHKEFDPRGETVREIAEAEGMIGPSVGLLDRIRVRASELVGTSLVLNVDGLMAALFLDMGFTPEQMLATNILSAIPGMAAHAIEEAQIGRRLRYPVDHESAYTLPAETRDWEAQVAAGDSLERPDSAAPPGKKELP